MRGDAVVGFLDGGLLSILKDALLAERDPGRKVRRPTGFVDAISPWLHGHSRHRTRTKMGLPGRPHAGCRPLGDIAFLDRGAILHRRKATATAASRGDLSARRANPSALRPAGSMERTDEGFDPSDCCRERHLQRCESQRASRLMARLAPATNPTATLGLHESSRGIDRTGSIARPGSPVGCVSLLLPDCPPPQLIMFIP